MKIESFIAEKVRDIAAEAILEALENGDALEISRFMRDQIRAGWHAALESVGMPEAEQKKLKFPI